MKKITLIISAVIAALALNGCRNNDESPEPMSVTRADTFFYARGGTGSIEIANAPATLTAEPLDNWCTITGVEGNTVNFKVPSIVDISSRTTEIIVTSGGYSKAIPVTQQGAVFLMEDTYELSYGHEGGTRQVLYKKNNTDLKIVPESLPEWIECSHEQDGLWVTVKENTQGSRNLEFAVSVYNGEEVYEQDISMIKIVQGSVLTAKSLPGTWKMTYTWYPDAPDAGYMGITAAVAVSEQKSMDIEIEVDPTDSNKFTAEIGGRPVRLELDPVTFDLKIPSDQRNIGSYEFEGTAYYPILIQFGFNGTKPTVNMGDKGWLQSESTFVSDGSSTTVSLKFVKAGTWAYATGFMFYGFSGPTPGAGTLVAGRVIGIYENIVLTRVY